MLDSMQETFESCNNSGKQSDEDKKKSVVMSTKQVRGRLIQMIESKFFVKELARGLERADEEKIVFPLEESGSGSDLADREVSKGGEEANLNGR